MSLINDALKRAKATQPKSPSADGPALMRPDFAPMPRRQTGGNDLVLPALIVVILLLAALLIWQWMRGDAGEIKVRARTVATFDNVQPAPPENAPAANPQSQPVPAPQVAIPPTISLPVDTNKPGTNAVVPETLIPTNQLPVTNAPPPAPTYKLQSIFYRAKSPSAVINGKTLFVGDRVGHTARVTAIGQESVTILTVSGETNVLELP